MSFTREKFNEVRSRIESQTVPVDTLQQQERLTRHRERVLMDRLEALKGGEWHRRCPGALPLQFYTTPPRWKSGDTKYRCIGDHITMESEVDAKVYACPHCNGVLLTTFPEDCPGPLMHVLGGE